MKRYSVLLLMLTLAFVHIQASAGIVNWTDWRPMQLNSPDTVSGTIGDISLRYTGDIAFAQTGSGINYWAEGEPAPYTGNHVVDNAPTPAELIAADQGNTAQTLQFSETVTDPLMAIVSMGQHSVDVTYQFDSAYTLLSEGRGYFGDGDYHIGETGALTGNELHAVIQFSGRLDRLSWTTLQPEHWHGFTMGLLNPGVSVPEPTTLVLLGLGLLCLVLRRQASERE